MSNFLGRVRGYVGMCGHVSALYVGGVKDNFSGVVHHVYSCGDCGRVYKLDRRVGVISDYVGCHVNLDGNVIMHVNESGEHVHMRISRFVAAVIDGKVSFPRERLGDLLGIVEKQCVLSVGRISNLNQRVNDLENSFYKSKVLLKDKDSQIKFLESVIENGNVIAYSEEQIKILNDNEASVNAAGKLVEMLTELLLSGKVLVPEGAYKLFRALLKSNYGYERMRNTWIWDMKLIGNDKFFQFSERKERRKR